jgi:hypothetical protein
VAKIQATAIAQGFDLARIIEDDGESAHNLQRPGLVQLFSELDRSPIGVVIVADISRVARDESVLIEILDRFHHSGTALICADEALDTRTTEGRRTVNELRIWDRLLTNWPTMCREEIEPNLSTPKLNFPVVNVVAVRVLEVGRRVFLNISKRLRGALFSRFQSGGLR